MPAGAGKQKAAWRANMRLRRVSQSPENRSAGVEGGRGGSGGGGEAGGPRLHRRILKHIFLIYGRIINQH